MADDLLAQLAPLRARIDSLDTEILRLIDERARTALRVGEVKEQFDAAGPVLKPEREAAIVRRLQQTNDGPLPAAAIAAIWGEIIAACRGLERPLTVAYLGPQGSFSEQAAKQHFGQASIGLCCDSFDEVFRAVEAGQASVGMVPVENSTEGAVNRSLDLLLQTSLQVLGERTLRIQHNLLSASGDMQGVQVVMAHPQALAQCQDWLARNHPLLERRPATSNSHAARIAAQDPGVAAIASDAAARAWGLQVVAAGIQDDPQNQTRFLAIGPEGAGPSGYDKTSLILAVPNRAGAVYEMLAPLSRHGVSMTRLESRPARTGQWEYYFYVDVLGHRQDEAMRLALAELRQQVAFFKVLGSYPMQ